MKRYSLYKKASARIDCFFSQYLETARMLKFYGYIRFDSCTSDYPEVGTETIISLGQKELILTPKADNMSDREAKFRITRIRCWKITPLSVSSTSFRILVGSNFRNSHENFLIFRNLIKKCSFRSNT